MATDQWVVVPLGDGQSIAFETDDDGPRDTASSAERIETSLEAFLAPIGTLIEAARRSVSGSDASEVTVELGVKVGVESGRLIAVVASGSVEANLKVTATWSS